MVLNLLSLTTVLLLVVPASFGQAGRFLGQVNFATNCGFVSSSGHSVGIGVTFDGTNLWYSCYDSKSSNDSLHRDLFKADPKTGAVLGAWDIAGGMGAIAYDASRNVIWAGEGGGLSTNVGWVIEIPLDVNENATAGGYKQAFKVPEAYSSPPSTQDIVDGLAIDATTGTLYIHYDFATTFQMYSTHSSNFGTFLGSIKEAPGIPTGTPVITPEPNANGSCVVSGLALGGSTIFEASDYCDAVWGVDKANPQNEEATNSFSIASSVPSGFDEKALTCDTNTFSGNDAIWVKGAFTPQAFAFELAPGTCGVGGQPAAATATATLSPSSLSFGNQNIGTTSPSQAITLSNTGASSLSISSIAITGTNAGDFSETNNCGSSLAANSSCTIDVTFKPTAAGTRAAALAVTDNVSGSPQTASLSGTGVSSTASLSPSSLTFASRIVGTTSAAQAVTLSNTGTGTLTISSVSIGGADPHDFAQTNNCGSSLAAGSNCALNVTFTPSATGTRSANLAVSDNSAGSPQTTSLMGTGLSTNPVASLSPTSLTFTSQNVGTTSAAQSLTLSNSGGAALSISSITITGTNATDFAQTNNCGTSLAAGTKCAINVTFKPTAIGGRSATLAVTDNAAGSPQTAGLAGTGVSLAVSVSPTSLLFGNQQVKTTSAAQSVTLTNTGSGTVAVGSISISGGSATSFAEATNCGTSLAAGAFCSINVIFMPTTTGSLSSTLVISDNATGSPQKVSLSGTGTAPTVSVSPTSISFGTVLIVGGSATQNVTVKNTGFGPVAVSGISITGPNAGDFSQKNNCPSSLAAGGSCTISVTFAPLLIGSKSATLGITDNALGSPQTVDLSGTGGL
jgi:ASPM-SPD-2-Hydin domain-containing protein/centrosomal CEP192-like protein/HYDIN/CFA65/VesB family protein